MNANKTGSRYDQKVDVKVVLSGLWISMVFVFAYVDIFGYLRADVINGVLDGKVAGTGVDITQSFLTLTTLYILLPALMVAFSLTAPAKFNRPVNLVLSVLYAVSVVAAAIGETWTYYLVGSVVEVLLLLTIAAVAWSWPVTPPPADATETHQSSARRADPPERRQPSHR